MNLSRHDLQKLWLPSLATLIMFLVAALLAWGSNQNERQAERERNAATSARNQIEQRLRQVRTEEQDIKDRSQRLQQLQEAGITGEEKRLDWIEMLRDIQRELRIPGMRYEFGAQIPLDKAEASGPAWFSSPMHLQLRLLHEEDLLNFLTRLQQNAKALVIIRSCKLAPLPHPGDEHQGLAQLGAECDTQWITTRPAGGKK